jgi:glycosyltransferase involved in cell wall biosynthesis
MNSPALAILAQAGAVRTPAPANITLGLSLALLGVSFVVPTLSEARNLPQFLPRIPKWANEVVIVDGRSTDDTVAVACRLLRTGREGRHGIETQHKGAALQAGFKAVTSGIIVMLDADGSMVPEEAIVFVGALRSRDESLLV